MSTNEQQPGGQHPGQQQYPGQQYPTQPYGTPQYPGEQYPGPNQYQDPLYPSYQPFSTPAPVRETGKRVASMILLVIGYVLGSILLLAAMVTLPQQLSDADVESAGEGVGYVIGTFVGFGLVVGPPIVLVILVHLWRRRIVRRENAQVKTLP
ncbi:hypothetical protein [Arthrobacter sp. zg-Y1143]|uniref:hypothetical protein n=1 Tax=Arthrobacter sp. zg-Y1143 TaxID=3049065 RepID=UPI0024C26CC6|nr:hypothetical protein [Arthrobacter sp. zg-Y1143]MDK1327470.1 hypothetical protein [Arthrobacter sp. zg-Y1143]